MRNAAHCVRMERRIETRRAVAQMLKRARGYSLMTQQQLADKLCVSRRSVAAWESGEHEPPFTAVLDWLHACNRPVSEFVKACAPWELNPEPAEYHADAAQGSLFDDDWESGGSLTPPRNQIFHPFERLAS
jgi:transcriptional regulator with XRE-family HTH domain